MFWNRKKALFKSNVDKVKEIWMEHRTSVFFVDEEGASERKASKKQDAVWKRKIFDERLSRLDVNDFNTSYLLNSMIENHQDLVSFGQMLEYLNKNIESCNNPYSAFRYSQSVFRLMNILVLQKSGVTKEQISYCIATCKQILQVAKQRKLHPEYSIPGYISHTGILSQEEYILKKIIELENDIKTVEELYFTSS